MKTVKTAVFSQFGNIMLVFCFEIVHCFHPGEKREMPLTGERAQYDLRRDEKLAMYDYVRTVAQRENPSSSFSERELLLLQDSKGELGVPVFLGQSPRSDRH